jgi:hypothetical protein
MGPGCAINTLNQPVPQAFSLAYLEFDDAGEFWSIGNERVDKVGIYPESQLELAVDLVKEKRQEAINTNRPLLVLTFVHGWQNNASPEDEKSSNLKNLASFKNSLQFISTENCSSSKLSSAGQCPIVVGIFFAWRGRTISIPGLHAITYEARRNAANRVGGPSMTEAVMLLSFAAKGSPPVYDQSNKCQQDESTPIPRVQFLIVGHSFGGRALEHGFTQSMLSLLLERKAQAEGCVTEWNLEHPSSASELRVKVVPPVDLIALINPANDALEAKSMIEAFKRSGIQDDELDHPLIVSVKSAGDSATGPIMWIGQSLVSGKPSERVYDRGSSTAPSACQQGQLGLKSQSFYYRRSAGGIYNMASHQISPTESDPSHAKPPFDREVTCNA